MRSSCTQNWGNCHPLPYCTLPSYVFLSYYQYFSHSTLCKFCSANFTTIFLLVAGETTMLQSRASRDVIIMIVLSPAFLEANVSITLVPFWRCIVSHRDVSVIRYEICQWVLFSSLSLSHIGLVKMMMMMTMMDQAAIPHHPEILATSSTWHWS